MSSDDVFLPQDILDAIKQKVEVEDKPLLTDCDWFHTGSYALDRIISVANGNIGIPAPCVVELAGAHSTAKTTLALEMIANVLEDNGFALMIDAEKRLNHNYAETILGDYFEKMVIVRERIVEEVFWKMEETARMLVEADLARLPAIYVLDSMGNIDPVSRYKKDDEDKKDSDPRAKYYAVDFGPGKAIKRSLGFVWDYISQTNAVILIINHEHDVIDLSNPMAAKFKKTKTTGGVFKDYMAGVKLSVKVIKTFKEGGRKTGSIVRVRNVKSSVGMPFGECELEVRFGEGVQREKDIYDTAQKLGLIYKEGGRWYYEGEEIGARDKGVKRLKEDHELYDSLVEDICDAEPDWKKDEDE